MYLNGTSCVHLRIKLSYIFKKKLVFYWNYLDNLQAQNLSQEKEKVRMHSQKRLN